MHHQCLDVPKHGGPAYPLDAYGHGYFEKILTIVENGQLSQLDQGFESGVYVKDEGPYEHPELKVMGIHNVLTTPSMIELDSINRLREVKSWEELDRIRESISPASLPQSSHTSKHTGKHASEKSKWGPGHVLSKLGISNKGLDLADEPGNTIGLEHMERTAL
ncbi:uncharacterized protein LOC131957647 [Physella acuta]|uniref:uncharacterized protein LOC131957647 n=1 Tax=Physella acuta TaxID=109671 RepID=UPI0027DDFABA|nr:uncharacterized protein LOC131957647 [Physella acuta]